MERPLPARVDQVHVPLGQELKGPFLSLREWAKTFPLKKLFQNKHLLEELPT